MESLTPEDLLKLIETKDLQLDNSLLEPLKALANNQIEPSEKYHPELIPVSAISPQLITDSDSKKTVQD